MRDDRLILLDNDHINIDSVGHLTSSIKLGSLGPFSSFVFCWKITWSISSQNNLAYRFRKSLFRAGGAFINYRTFNHWVVFLQRPENRVIREANLDIWHKVLRGYLSLQWRPSKVMKIIEDTYKFAAKYPGPIQDALLYSKEVIISNCSLGSVKGRVIITLTHENRFEREGELVLKIYCNKFGGHLSSLAFSLEETKHGWVAYVGAVQGCSEVSSDVIKSASKAMHGMRAKSMSIFTLMAVVEALNFIGLRGAGDSIHLNQRKHLVHMPWNKLSFEYDKFWSEIGGERDLDGWFILPLLWRRRTREKIKPNKRSSYVRRYELLDQITAKINISFEETRKKCVASL